MKSLVQVLNHEEMQLIHDKSIQILEEVGMKFPSETVLDILERNGARIDYENQVAYISKNMVDKALKSTPNSFALGARNPKNDIKMPASFTGYNLDGCNVNLIDYKTGNRRIALQQDIADAAKIFDFMDMGTIYWPPLIPEDVPSGARSIATTALGFMNTGKHIQDEIKELRELPYILEMTKAIAGDSDAAKRRMLYSVVYCTVAPLCHDKEMLEANVEAAKNNIPIVILPMPACGTTGPASIYSNIALANAEILSCIVIFQIVAKGCPLVYGSAQGVANPVNGLFLFGCPETALQDMAMIQMARFYDMPVTIAGCTTDAKTPGMQTIMEKMLTTLPLALAGPDSIVGMGMYECSGTFDFAQLIIDNEIAQHCKRICDGITIDEKHDYIDDIKAVAQGGHFLKRTNTRKAFRSSEFYLPSLVDRGSYDEWITGGERDMYAKANSKVIELLKKEPECPMDRGLEKLINEIMEEAKARLI